MKYNINPEWLETLTPQSKADELIKIVICLQEEIRQLQEKVRELERNQ